MSADSRATPWCLGTGSVAAALSPPLLLSRLPSGKHGVGSLIRRSPLAPQLPWGRGAASCSSPRAFILVPVGISGRRRPAQPIPSASWPLAWRREHRAVGPRSSPLLPWQCPGAGSRCPSPLTDPPGRCHGRRLPLGAQPSPENPASSLRIGDSRLHSVTAAAACKSLGHRRDASAAPA